VARTPRSQIAWAGNENGRIDQAWFHAEEYRASRGASGVADEHHCLRLEVRSKSLDRAPEFQDVVLGVVIRASRVEKRNGRGFARSVRVTRTNQSDGQNFQRSKLRGGLLRDCEVIVRWATG
jgi:hypothetical protein